MSPLVLFSLFIFLSSLFVLFQVFMGSRKMKNLGDTAAKVCTPVPLVSVIVPACNEEETLEPALRSLLKQDYPNREFIVIDDRSTDGTFGLIEKLGQEFPEIRMEQITELPTGWLGKNHALYQGAKQARGKILLFTDADVVMESSTLSRAVTYFTREGLDHLTMVFRNVARSGLLNAMVVDALGGLFLLLRPWNVRNRRSRSFAGVGAFNMISSKTYWEFGGHAAFKMHPIDDIMLGKKVKQQGLVQDCLVGSDFVRVRWYETFGEMVNGLMKNIFALYSYRIIYVAAALSVVWVMTIVPVWGVILAPGIARIFFAAAVLARFAVFMLNARGLGGRPALFLWSLLTPYLTTYIVMRAVWVTLRNQGIDWRGTHYSLEELKKEEPLFTLFP
ncbi:MAG: glycosyltransferase family 2 protein [Desulfocapsa sp.]|nr:glycosyltransferase family 2 protein [Desulfocapsa sp.]